MEVILGRVHVVVVDGGVPGGVLEESHTVEVGCGIVDGVGIVEIGRDALEAKMGLAIGDLNLVLFMRLSGVCWLKKGSWEVFLDKQVSRLLLSLV